MLSNSELLNGLPPTLTLRFFATFARFEFALKQCGYLKRANEGDVAEASRRRLEEHLSADFFDKALGLKAAHVLIEQPPMKLRVGAHNQIMFGTQPAQISTARELLNAVWDVRNNLFHGNKMYPANRKRDFELMNGALAVIQLALQDHPGLSDAFHQPPQ